MFLASGYNKHAHSYASYLCLHSAMSSPLAKHLRHQARLPDILSKKRPRTRFIQTLNPGGGCIYLYIACVTSLHFFLNRLPTFSWLSLGPELSPGSALPRPNSSQRGKVSFPDLRLQQLTVRELWHISVFIQKLAYEEEDKEEKNKEEEMIICYIIFIRVTMHIQLVWWGLYPIPL